MMASTVITECLDGLGAAAEGCVAGRSLKVELRHYVQRIVVGAAVIAGVTVASLHFGLPVAQIAASRLPDITVAREDDRSFTVARSGSAGVRVTFLSPTAVRIRVLDNEKPQPELRDYMRVKDDASYPPPQVALEASRDEVTFTTTAAIVSLAAGDNVISLSVRTPGKVLVDRWTIDATHRTTRIDLAVNEHIYGFGDKRAALDQRGNKVEMANRDAYASETNASYKSIPFYMSSAGYGLFFHNFHPSVFDIGASNRNKLELKANGGEMDFYFFLGGQAEVLAQYTELTGRPAMLPRWAFGYHQGKASYEGRQGLAVAETMRRRKLPVDVIYYDDWEDEAVKREFVRSLWQRHRVRLTLGFGMPMFGSFDGNDDDELLRDLIARGYVMVDQDRKPVIGSDHQVDGDEEDASVGYLDFFSPRAVDYVFAEKWEEALDNGVILGMVDFGELDGIGNPERKFWPSLGLSVAQTRNLFSLVYPLAVVSGALKRVGGRSVGMVRPGFAGTQRLGWTTTGDSYPDYRNFRAHTRAMLNLTLSGFSNVGQDIGGWDGKGPDILYARWFAAGTFHPFMWSHGTGDHEPYAHGETVEKVARKFLNLRYRLIPYFYSLHELAHRTGLPVMRSFPLQEPAEPAASRIDDQFFIGDNLLVAPLFNDAGDRKLYLPNGLWYDFFGELPPVAGGRDVERISVPLDRLPVYVRAGAILPLGPAMQYTGERPVDPLTVHVYGHDRQALGVVPRTSEFSLYEDDGLSNAYQQGKFQRTALRFRQTQHTVGFDTNIVSGDGEFRSVPQRAYELHFHGLQSAVSRVLLDGNEIPRANAASAGGPHWWIDQTTGDVSVFIPRSAKPAFALEFAAEGPRTCGGNC
jgi:alpha-glucosidase (family GH31 glycosyl hydrolase)